MAKVTKRAAMVGFFFWLRKHKVLLIEKGTQYPNIIFNHRKLQLKAVPVCCNYPHTRFRFYGCTNDVKSVKAVIENRFWFRESSIMVLTDDDRDGAPGSSSLLPTRANFKAALHEMAKRTFELEPLQEDEGILLSGCEADETSYDIVSDDRAFGAFTRAVVNFLNHHAGATISNGELLAAVAKALEEQGYMQSPCLYCSDKNASEPFLGGFV